IQGPEKEDGIIGVLAGAVGAVCFLIISTVIVFIVLFKRKQAIYTKSGVAQKEEDRISLHADDYLVLTEDPTDFCTENIYDHEGSFVLKRASAPSLAAEKSENVEENETQNEYKYATVNRHNVTDDDNDEEGVENPYGDLYINEETTFDVPISELQNDIVERKKNEDEGFKREYAMLPYGEEHPCDAGKRPENLPKNRFRTTFPYDHSRVVLKGTNDYINASFIHGTNKSNEYIASQGPKENTLSDFWVMLWQEKVTQIVMLTNVKEGVKMKCIQYWPEIRKVSRYGNITIRTVEEKQYAFYVIRKLKVANKEAKKYRFVTHYQFTTWPGHGSPDPLCLAAFHSHVMRTSTDHSKSPLVVHCSAGIGRTGTYIALDALYKCGKTTGKINVAKYVKDMRSNRMNMIQTYEQYKTVLLTLNEEFKARIEPQSLSNFAENLANLTENVNANQSYIRQQFEKLKQVRPEYTSDDYKNSRQRASKKKNKIFPLDKYVLHLTSSVGKRGSYINAITVPSYINAKAFIVTQYPPPEDAVDFLRLLIDHESDTVICMDPLTEIKSSKAWLPDPTSFKHVAPFTVQHENETESDVKFTYTRIINAKEQEHTVLLVEPKLSKKSTGTPRDTSYLLSLVSYALHNPSEGPLSIVSKDGASLCGVFCAVFNCIQQINMDDSVDVFTTVRQLQKRRPEFCSTQEEYLLVHTTLREYIEKTTENLYTNQ
ncbi:receptor-type tyrosine-protein phosphatase T-like, partial [Crassostrea virginica]